MLLGTLGANLLRNMLSGKGIIYNDMKIYMKIKNI